MHHRVVPGDHEVGVLPRLLKLPVIQRWIITERQGYNWSCCWPESNSNNILLTHHIVVDAKMEEEFFSTSLGLLWMSLKGMHSGASPWNSSRVLVRGLSLISCHTLFLALVCAPWTLRWRRLGGSRSPPLLAQGSVVLPRPRLLSGR